MSQNEKYLSGVEWLVKTCCGENVELSKEDKISYEIGLCGNFTFDSSRLGLITGHFSNCNYLDIFKIELDGVERLRAEGYNINYGGPKSQEEWRKMRGELEEIEKLIKNISA